MRKIMLLKVVISILLQLEYKSKWNGRNYIKIDTFYAISQLCSVCGYQNPDTKDLSVRM
ncbi:zinc ribbon domain-containing protein [Roseburia intestinalis]|uniref:zinc ribbon domain-containing protein n=1 Tax=Roseburia intestinalis TaxID=166486 RepID=UPI002FE505E4